MSFQASIWASWDIVSTNYLPTCIEMDFSGPNLSGLPGPSYFWKFGISKYSMIQPSHNECHEANAKCKTEIQNIYQYARLNARFKKIK